MSANIISFIANQTARLDHILTSEYSQRTRSQWGALLRAGKVKVDGAIVTKAGTKVHLGATVEIEEVTISLVDLKPHFKAENIALPTLFEDDYLWIIDKPAGIVVHPGPGHDSGTVFNALLWRLNTEYIRQENNSDPNLNSNSDRVSPLWPGLVHRIDRYTTGCLAMAKDADSQKNLQLQFQSRTVSKKYLALVRSNNHLLIADYLEINKPIARHHTNRLKMAISTSGRSALTKIKVLARSCGLTLLECDLFTGRTHQIRTHLAHLNMAILGDTLYGGSSSWTDSNSRSFLVPHTMLHAWKLSIDHPRHGNRIIVEAQIPQAYQEILAKLDIQLP